MYIWVWSTIKNGNKKSAFAISTTYPDKLRPIPRILKTPSAATFTALRIMNARRIQINMKCGFLNAIEMDLFIAVGVSALSITTAGGTKNNNTESTSIKSGYIQDCKLLSTVIICTINNRSNISVYM